MFNYPFLYSIRQENLPKGFFLYTNHKNLLIPVLTNTVYISNIIYLGVAGAVATILGVPDLLPVAEDDLRLR